MSPLNTLTSAVVAIGVTISVTAWAVSSPAAQRAISTVKVETHGGYGSGVHIGKGLILTAAHVVADENFVDIVTEKKRKQVGRVLWASKAHDIALVATDPALDAATAYVSCVAPEIGDQITAIGNPAGIEFARSYGTVATGIFQTGPFASVIAMDVTTVMGMSGGPVFNDRGRVVGITVAVQTVPSGPFGASLTRFGMMVPTSVVCRLLAR